MAYENAGIDNNFTRSLLGVSTVDGVSTVKVYADPTTHRLLVDLAGGGVAGSLQTDIFVATANQTIFNASKTVAATIFLSVQGVIQTPSNVDTSGYYTVAGNTATFSSGQVVGSIVIWVYATT